MLSWEVKVHGTKLGWTALPESNKALGDSSCQHSRKLSLILQKTYPDALHWYHFSHDEKLSMGQNKPEDWFQVLLLLAYRD